MKLPRLILGGAVFLAALGAGWTTNYLVSPIPRDAGIHKDNPRLTALTDLRYDSGSREAGKAAVAVIDEAATPAEQLRTLGEFRDQLAGDGLSLAAVLEQADTLLAPHLRNAARALAMHEWAQKDPHGVLQYGLEIEGKGRDRFMFGLFEAWAGIDLTAALDTLSEHPKLLITQRKILMASLARQHPLGVYEALRSGRDADALITHSDQVFTELAKIDVAGALEKTDSLPSKIRGDARATVVKVWAQADPGAALDWLDKNREVPAQAALAIASNWYVTDPQALVARLASVDRRDVKQKLAEGASLRWVNSDIEGAVDYALSSDGDPILSRQIAGRGVERLWIKGGGQRAIELINAHPDAGRYGESIIKLLKTHPSAVGLDDAQRLAEEITTAETRDFLLLNIELLRKERERA